jgi:hypothetical protein
VAILGTPTAQAFIYFLLQHKANLGNLYISQARVFRDNRKRPGTNLLLIVESAPLDAQPDEQSAIDISSFFANLTRRNVAAGRVDTAVVEPANLPSALTTWLPRPWLGQGYGFLNLYTNAWDTEWENAQCKGANFVRALRGSDSEAGKIFNPPCDTAAGLYDETNIGRTLWSSNQRQH